MKWWEDAPPPPGTPILDLTNWQRGSDVFEDHLRPTGILSASGDPVFRRPAFGFGRTDEYVVLRGDKPHKD